MEVNLDLWISLIVGFVMGWCLCTAIKCGMFGMKIDNDKSELKDISKKQQES